MIPNESGLRQLVSARFQVLFTSLIGGLFNIQSLYWFAIGRQRVFSLGGWTPLFHAGFHEPDATLVRLGLRLFRLQDHHLLWLAFPDHSPLSSQYHVGAHNPAPKDGLGCSDFARRY